MLGTHRKPLGSAQGFFFGSVEKQPVGGGASAVLAASRYALFVQARRYESLSDSARGARVIHNAMAKRAARHTSEL